MSNLRRWSVDGRMSAKGCTRRNYKRQSVNFSRVSITNPEVEEAADLYVIADPSVAAELLLCELVTISDAYERLSERARNLFLLCKIKLTYRRRNAVSTDT
jgi:DNA-directed RNA polymerase specialized sigma24 family protein